MSEVIQCPQCDKRFRLPEHPPATFTCTACGTLMDLSDFGGGAQEPPRPAREEPGARPRSRRQRARGGPAPSAAPGPSRGARGGRRRGAGGARRGGGRRRRGASEADEVDEARERRAAARAQREEKKGIVIGAIVAIAVVAVIVVFIVASNKKDEPSRGGKTTASGGPSDVAPLPGTTGSQPGASDASGTQPGTAAQPAGSAPGTTPAGTSTQPAGTTPTPEKPAPAPGTPTRHTAISHIKLQSFDWPKEVDAETRSQVEDAIQSLYSGGRDANDAENFLVSKGRPICGRLISEFATLQKSPGFDNREGRSRASVIDHVLRKIDGWQERRWYEARGIMAASDPMFVMRVARRWNAWWATGEWKSHPRKPFDRFTEDIEDLRHPKKKAKDKGTGFGKRAGG